MRNALDHLLRTGQRGSCIQRGYCIQVPAFHHLGTDASIGFVFDVGRSQIFGTGYDMGVDIAPTKPSGRASALAAFPRSFAHNPRRPDRPPHPPFLFFPAYTTLRYGWRRPKSRFVSNPDLLFDLLFHFRLSIAACFYFPFIFMYACCATRLALLFLWLLLFHFRLAACFHATRLARLSPAYLRRTHHRCLFCIIGPPRTPAVSNTLRARPRLVLLCIRLVPLRLPATPSTTDWSPRTPFPSGGLYGAAATRGSISRTRCHATPESGRFLGR